ncbi:MAG: glycosyltransferase family 1 protein [Candidatus Roizmanbacteria bacterium]|nr:glycosyltransferase family 1 protein [Candidatus Roizmanbacteria bacterium]
MKIGIDISMLVYQGSGVANYTYNLVKHLLKDDKKNEYRLFYSSFRRPKNFYYLNGFRQLGAKVYDYRFPPSFLKFVWGKHHLLPVEWLIGKVDVFHSSDFLRPPLSAKTKAITTIHDLTWKLFPEFHEQRIIDAHEWKLKKTIEYGDTIITDSQNTKKDLLKYYPHIQKTNRVEVIYPGIDERFRIIKNEKRITEVLRKYGVQYPSKFLLYVGAIEPRKNLDTAIKVFHQLISEKKYEDFKFLIVGRAGWKNEDVFQSIKRLKLEDKVRFVGFVKDDDLPYFYNGAKAFIYLSKYEGFGLPPIEAAACGCPALLYNNSSLNEIFKPGYPYAKEGRELETLKRLINDTNFNVNKFTYDFSWKNYVKKFLSIITF